MVLGPTVAEIYAFKIFLSRIDRKRLANLCASETFGGDFGPDPNALYLIRIGLTVQKI